ncbi:hypothetical protein CMK18_11100 [Candidatus Poribacteria bacterium]|nr:hypothetical protein [Candidatus Poribacteria bacterium]
MTRLFRIALFLLIVSVIGLVYYVSKSPQVRLAKSRSIITHEIQCADGSRMTFIPAGEFYMGSTKTEINSMPEGFRPNIEHYADEMPQIKVYVDDFYIDKFEVTNAQYNEFVSQTGYPPPYYAHDLAKPYNWSSGTFPAGTANHPVVLVSWQDAYAYARWAGKRLPTETEWEKAARGTDGRIYPWGNEWNGSKCNNAERVAGRPLNSYTAWRGFAEIQRTKLEGAVSGPWNILNFTPSAQPITVYADDTRLKHLQPVGSYPEGRSPYGIHDMAGNAMEWCANWYDPKLLTRIKSDSQITNYQGTYRSVRGGSWMRPLDDQRASARDACPPSGYLSVKEKNEKGKTQTYSWPIVAIGFRCAMDIDDAKRMGLGQDLPQIME